MRNSEKFAEGVLAGPEFGFIFVFLRRQDVAWFKARIVVEVAGADEVESGPVKPEAAAREFIETQFRAGRCPGADNGKAG